MKKKNTIGEIADWLLLMFGIPFLGIIPITFLMSFMLVTVFIAHTTPSFIFPPIWIWVPRLILVISVGAILGLVFKLFSKLK